MTCNLLTVRKRRINNDDDVAKETFLEVLDCAEKTLTVRDDGDRSSGVYRDDDVVERVRDRLRSNPKLTIRVLFNYREDGNKLAVLQAQDEFQGRERLDIRYLLPQQRPSREVHGKIADMGRRGCLSVHELSAELSAEKSAQKRNLETFDCSRSWLGRQFVFRRYIAEFNRQFVRAEP